MTKTAGPTDGLETVAQLAARAGCEPETVRKAIRHEELEATQLGRDYLIAKPAADAFVARQAARRTEESERIERQLSQLRARKRDLKRRSPRT